MQQELDRVTKDANFKGMLHVIVLEGYKEKGTKAGNGEL